MAEFSAGFRVYADASQFQKEMKASVESAKQVQKGLKDIGVNIGAGLGVVGIISGFKNILQAAQDVRAELEAQGKPIDENTASVAGYADAWDSAKDAAKDFGILTLSGFTKIGEAIGMGINVLRGFSLAEQRAGELSEKLANAQMKKRDELYKHESEIIAKLAKEREEAKNVDKGQIETERTLAKFKESERVRDKKIAKEKIEVEEKAKQLKIEQLELERLARIEAEKMLEIKKQENELNNPSAGKILNGQGKTNYLLDGKWYGGESKSMDDIAGASDAALSTLIKQRKGQVGSIRANQATGAGASTDVATGGLIRGIVEGFLITDIQNAMKQLDLRKSMRDAASRGGIESARDSFQGDPLAFDRLYSQFAENQDAQDKTNTLLQKMLDQQKAGLPVIQINKVPQITFPVQTK